MILKLQRSIGLRYVVVVVIANVIGSGVYKKAAPMAAELNSSGWVLIAWAVGGIITLFGALSNAEVAGLLADTGGEYAYYKKIYTRFFAFVYGWSAFAVIQTAGISSLAYVFAESLNHIVSLPHLFPSMSNYNIAGVFYPFADFSVKLTAIVLIILLTWINTKGIRFGAGMSNILLALVFFGIFLIVIFGLGSKESDLSKTVTFATLNNKPVGIAAFFTAMLAAFWAYQGWAAIGFIGGEVKDANKIIPRGIALGVLIVIGVYLLVNATYLSLLPIEKLKAIYESGNSIAAVEAVRSFWGTEGVFFISVLILISTLGCAHATILACARTYFAMAGEGLFFKKAAQLNKANVPCNSLIIQCIWACLLVLSGTFDQLTDMIIFAVFIYYAATALGVFVLRKKMRDAPRPYKVWGYPFVPAIFIIFSAGLVLNTVFTRPREAILGMLLILTSVPMYLWFEKSRIKQSAGSS
jgi:APA family basic amino acid/polyamine antiporter